MDHAEWFHILQGSQECAVTLKPRMVVKGGWQESNRMSSALNLSVLRNTNLGIWAAVNIWKLRVNFNPITVTFLNTPCQKPLWITPDGVSWHWRGFIRRFLTGYQGGTRIPGQPEP